jgi:hypothetical protein
MQAEADGARRLRGSCRTDPGANYVAYAKGEERYVLAYWDDQIEGAFRTLGRWASNPELSFSWYDAARLSQRIRQQAKQIVFKDEQ